MRGALTDATLPVVISKTCVYPDIRSAFATKDVMAVKAVNRDGYVTTMTKLFRKYTRYSISDLGRDQSRFGLRIIYWLHRGEEKHLLDVYIVENDEKRSGEGV
jgi:hypothetical protein